MNKVSSFLPWTTKQININQSLKGKCLQQEPARTVLVTTDQTPHFKWGSGQIQRSVGQNQKLFTVMWLLTKVSHGRVSQAKRGFHPRWWHTRRAAGFTQHQGAWAEMHTSSQGGHKASPSLFYSSDQQGLRTHKQTPSFCSGIGTTDVLEAIAEEDENWVFTPTESLPFRPGTLTGLRCSTRYIRNIAHQGPDWNHKAISSRQHNSCQMVIISLI